MPVRTFTIQANGDTESFVHYGGTVHMTATGDFGAGTLTVQKGVDDVTFTNLGTDTETTKTEAGFARFDARQGDFIRLNMAGATSPSVTVTLQS